MSILKRSISWLWQLPQNVCGLVWRLLNVNNTIALIATKESNDVGAKVYLMKNSSGGVTLGKYIFITQNFKDQEAVIKHECGHMKQSKILGPLYLIIIGLPSISHALLNTLIGCCKKHKEGYYHFYTEKWANKLMENED